MATDDTSSAAADTSEVERSLHGIDERASAILGYIEGLLECEKRGVLEHTGDTMDRGSMSRAVLKATMDALNELQEFHIRLKRELGIETVLGEIDEEGEDWRVPLARPAREVSDGCH